LLISVVLLESCVFQQNEELSSYQNKTEATITDLEKNQILKDIQQLMLNHYVNSENLESKLQEVSTYNYQDLQIADYFAQILTQNLQAAFNDKHLVIHHDTLLINRLKYEQRKVNNWNDIKYYEAYQEHKDAIQDNNYDFTKLEILSGNVGYLKFSYFAKLEEAKATIEATMQFMANVDALILDLQNNSGGHVNTTSWLGSFFSADTSTIFFRNIPEEGKIRYPTENTTGPENLKRIPLYILVSEQTASAAEVLTTALQENKRARVIGSTTWGGAHACRMEILNDGFALLLPFSEILGPASLSNWEGKGVQPDIIKNSENIIDNVHHLAISDLLNKNPHPKKKYLYTGILKAIESKFSNVKHYDTNDYAGTYGHLEFTVKNDHLHYLKEGRYSLKMTPYQNDYFVLDDYKFTKVFFKRNFWNTVKSVHFVNYKNDTLSYLKN